MKPKSIDISKGSIRRLARRGGDACTACLALPIEGWRWSCQWSPWLPRRPSNQQSRWAQRRRQAHGGRRVLRHARCACGLPAPNRTGCRGVCGARQALHRPPAGRLARAQAPRPVRAGMASPVAQGTMLPWHPVLPPCTTADDACFTTRRGASVQWMEKRRLILLPRRQPHATRSPDRHLCRTMYGFGEALPGLDERAGRLRRRPNAEARKVRPPSFTTRTSSMQVALWPDMLAFWHSALTVRPTSWGSRPPGQANFLHTSTSMISTPEQVMHGATSWREGASESPTLWPAGSDRGAGQEAAGARRPARARHARWWDLRGHRSPGLRPGAAAQPLRARLRAPRAERARGAA